MKTIVTGKGVVINDKIQDAIDKRFEKLGKFFAEDIQAKIVIHPEKAKVKTEATITTKGAVFRAEDVSQDVFDGIDNVAEKLQKQLSKQKGKLMKKSKSSESIRFEMIPETDNEEDENVVKTKKYDLTPMSVDEAILQMELLSHNFFVFLNSETNTVNVLYKRNDQGYGLIETDR